MKTYRVVLFGLAGLAALLVGCTSNEPFRRNLPDPEHLGTTRSCHCTDFAPDTTNCATLEHHAQYTLGYVEFDDQGWFWSHQQWAAVKAEIEAAAATATHGLKLIVFVHGWKNNAADDNGNLQMFRNVLGALNRTTNGPQVFVVYLGWRGLAAESDILLPFAKELSFWDRKGVAERIGHQGAATQVFVELEALQERFNLANKDRADARTDLIIIGHSFGGDLVFSAISQILMERLVAAAGRTNAEPVKSFGDLVVLLNPAMEASLYYNLIGYATSAAIQYPPSQRPVLAIFTSKTDWATHYMFPAGRFFTTMFEATRSTGAAETNRFNLPKPPSANQDKAVLEAVGHDVEFINYDLGYVPLSASATNKVSELLANLALQPGKFRRQSMELQSVLAENSVANRPEAMKPYVFKGEENGLHYECLLQPRTNQLYAFKPRNPFLNVSVDKHIMDGHNDITNVVLLKFLRDFILFTRTNATEL